MTADKPPPTTDLAERIRLLEAENLLLNERSEDVLLLGLMAENLAPLRNVEEIVDTLLERVSVLYEISYCGFGRIDGHGVDLLHEFVPFADRVVDSSLRLSPKALQALEDGSLVCTAKTAAPSGVELSIAGVVPTQIILLQGSCRYERRGVFVFAHDGADREFLPRKLIVLQQAIGLATARIDNILLLDELQRMNNDLERRVRDRTAELHRAAYALESEVAERQLAERIVEAERHRLRTVVENLPEGVIVLDSDRRVALANGAVLHAEPLTGPVEFGKRLRAIADTPIQQFLSDATETAWFEVSTERDPQLIYEIAVRELGQEQGSVIVLRDVSEQRKVADQLLRQERLAAMGNLAAGIAHDFNNLIQAVTILAEGLLLDDQASPESRRAKTRDILAQGERAAALIRQILDYARQTVNRPQVIDLRAYLEETLTMLERLIPETVRFRLEAPDEPLTVRIDPIQLQQVLTNLTLNSSQAMPGGGEIRVGLSTEDRRDGFSARLPELDGGAWVCLSVADTGCGIPADAQPRIFEPFFTTKEPGQGTGLGLAQTYGIVQQNSGYISFSSQPGVGTTFEIYLPAEVCEADVRTSAAIGLAMPEGAGETVMVVEDDDDVRMLIRDLVETLGYQPICASNGAEALEIIDSNSQPVAVVLTDVVMPKMGGPELLAALKQRGSAARVIMMSGYDRGFGDTSHAGRNLAGWLQKPFSVNTLAVTLSEALGDDDFPR